VSLRYPPAMSATPRESASVAHPSGAFEAQVYRKVSYRLLPILFLCYILAFLDRVNVGFGKLQMQRDIGLDDAAYGLGAGIFFIGYFLFEIPGNLMLQKVGARRWIGSMVMIWGLVSASTLLVQGTASFAVLRLILGVVESGFFPGVIFYLTFWYPQSYRAKVVALFMSAVALSGIIGGPVSGWILSGMSGTSGLRGWQWLYLLEGLPSVLAGMITLYFLEDTPSHARWLTREERDLVLQHLADDDTRRGASGKAPHSLSATFRNSKVWLFAFMYFGIMTVSYGLSFWLPQILKDEVSADPWRIGLLSAIPWLCGGTGMIIWGHHSDKTGERRWHFLLAAVLAAVAFSCSVLPGLSSSTRILALALAAIGILSAQSTFWSMPTQLLSGAAAGVGIAWINSVGNLGGFVSPYLVGSIRDATHNMFLALISLSVCCFLSGVATLLLRNNRLLPAKAS
jgi:D-galactonate transporter